MQVQVAVIAGMSAGQTFNLEVTPGSRMSIGRSADNAMAFPNERSVSSHHAELVNTGKTLVLVDRGSTNGTFVNNQRIQSLPVSPGMVARFGRRGPVLQFHLPGVPMPAGGPPPGAGMPAPGPGGPYPGPGAPYQGPGGAYPGPQQGYGPPPMGGQGMPPGYGTPMAPATACSACGAPLGPDAFQCAGCMRAQCAAHYDANAGCCVSCASARNVGDAIDGDPFDAYQQHPGY